MEPVEAISQQVLDVVVHGADASDTAKSGRYNLSEATLELDQNWTAWLTHCVRTSLMASSQLRGVNRRSDDCDCTSDIPTSVNVGAAESNESAKSSPCA